MADVTVKILGDASHFQRTLGHVEGGFSKIAGVAARVGSVVGGVGIAAGIGKAVSEAREAAKIGRLTEQVIKTTGGAANVSAGQVSGLAEKLSNLAGVDDEAIQGASNLLLTFTKVRNEVGKGNNIFDRATTAALDMSTALGTDLDGAALQVGKALNDPVKGMTALSRAGVSFTQEQKDQVKAMVAAGDTLGAQKLILAEMETQFGGAAEAAADPMQKLSVIAGNLMESLGTALLPTIEKVATWMGKHLPGAVRAVSGVIGGVVGKVKLFATALRTGTEGGGTPLEKIAVKVREFGQAVVEWVGKAVKFFREELVPAMQELWVRAQPTLDKLKETFRSAFGAIKAVVATVIRIVQEAWDRFGRGLVDNIKQAVGNIIEIVGGLLTALGGIFDLIKAIFTGKWGEAWEAVKQIASGVWDAIKNVVQLGIDAVRIVIETVMGTISGIWSTLWNGIKTFFADIWDGIKLIAKEAIDWIVDQMDRFLGPLDEWISKVGGLLGLGGDDVPTIPLGEGIEQRREDSAERQDDALARNRGPGGGVTVNVQTNADPVEIGRVVHWELGRVG